MKKLSQRQQRFVEEFLVDCNARAAARRAGYHPDYADKLMSLGPVKEAVDQMLENRRKRLEVTVQSVVEEIRHIAFSSMKDFLIFEKGQNGALFATTKPIDQIPQELLPAISEIKNTPHGVQVKLANKTKALELLAKYLGMLDGYLAADKQKDTVLNIRVFDEHGNLAEMIEPMGPN